ncbi:unnamed protein product [Rotaria sordida]|uniref:Uncharacterized protein n=1 Tax=Rotaria sordida TaxID=392033 RepID=A0A814SB93_9BILA|nr:unnamed protein product [Rotaria sordida]CAF1160891.1 unnamed protein product [Rotaria sordida]CAF1379424.1 unnamed protein product [Rotaria sordida]
MDNPNNNNIPAPFPNDPSTGSSPPAYNQHLPLITRPRARSLARPGSEIQHHSAIPVRAQDRPRPIPISSVRSLFFFSFNSNSSELSKANSSSVIFTESAIQLYSPC